VHLPLRFFLFQVNTYSFLLVYVQTCSYQIESIPNKLLFVLSGDRKNHIGEPYYFPMPTNLHEERAVEILNFSPADPLVFCFSETARVDFLILFYSAQCPVFFIFYFST
jgi:hypothetical protein